MATVNLSADCGVATTTSSIDFGAYLAFSIPSVKASFKGRQAGAVLNFSTPKVSFSFSPGASFEIKAYPVTASFTGTNSILASFEVNTPAVTCSFEANTENIASLGVVTPVIESAWSVLCGNMGSLEAYTQPIQCSFAETGESVDIAITIVCPSIVSKFAVNNLVGHDVLRYVRGTIR